MIIVIAEIGKFGGSKTFVLDLLDLLADFENNKAKVFVQNTKDFSDKEINKLSKNGIEIGKIPSFFLRGNKHFKRLGISNCIQFFYYLYIYIKFKPNWVIVSSTQPYHLLSGALVFKSNFIYFQHSYPNHKPSFSKGIVQKIYQKFNNYFFNLPFRFITVSQFAKQKMEKDLGLYKSNSKIDIVPNGVDIGNKRSGLNNNKTVLTCGSVEFYKNPDFWIDVAQEVIKKIPEVKFLWLGDGSMMAQMKSKAAIKDEERIIFRGIIDDVASFYENAWVYFQPSLAESQGIAVLEAMANSVPCVVSNVGGLPESVDNGVNGFVIELEIGIAVQKIVELLQNVEKNLSFGEAGRQKVLKKFNKRLWRQKVIEMLKQ